jgi:hypothetical protein
MRVVMIKQTSIPTEAIFIKTLIIIGRLWLRTVELNSALIILGTKPAKSRIIGPVAQKNTLSRKWTIS